MCDNNPKEEKILPHELAADELADVTGGYQFADVPKGYIRCCIMDGVQNGFLEGDKFIFCVYLCQRRIAMGCVQHYHHPTYSNESIRAEFKEYQAMHNRND